MNYKLDFITESENIYTLIGQTCDSQIYNF